MKLIAAILSLLSITATAVELTRIPDKIPKRRTNNDDPQANIGPPGKLYSSPSYLKQPGQDIDLKKGESRLLYMKTTIDRNGYHSGGGAHEAKIQLKATVTAN